MANGTRITNKHEERNHVIHTTDLLSSRLETVDCRLGKLCSRSTQIYNTLFQLKLFIHSKLYSLVYFFVFSLFYKMVVGEMTYENYTTKIITEFK